MKKKLVGKIEIVVMNGGGWNAAVPGGPWATDASPELALKLLLSGLEQSDWRLAANNHEYFSGTLNDDVEEFVPA